MMVETLKRLYLIGKITLSKLEALKMENKITQEEFDYITGA